MKFDRDANVYQALRIHRNHFIAYARLRLNDALGGAVPTDEAVKELYSKEWSDIERSASIAHESGSIDRQPEDALDHLSVNHIPVLIEKYAKAI